MWLSKAVYDGSCAYWEFEKFKGKSLLGKTNRASPFGVGSSMHCGGSIPHSKHRRRLAIYIFFSLSNMFILSN